MRNPFSPRSPPSPPAAAAPAPAAEPRWLTYRCATCRGRYYSGFTATALERHLAERPAVEPDFFHADCGVETPLAAAELRFADDDTPWRAPGRAP